MRSLVKPKSLNSAISKNSQLPPNHTALALWQTYKIISQPRGFLDTCAHRYGDIFTLRVLGVQSPPVIFCSHPDHIQAICTTFADKMAFGKVTHPFQPLVGSQSLIMQDGSEHTATRKLLMPPLHGESLQAWGEAIVEITRQATHSWSPGKVLSVRPEMSQIALEVILQVIFGVKTGFRHEKLTSLVEPFLDKVNSSLYSIQFFFPILQRNLGSWSPWGNFVQQQRQIDDLIYAEIQQRRRQGGSDCQDVLSLLLSVTDENGHATSDRWLRDQLLTLLFLGHDTTASALAWALYCIHQDKRVWQKLQQEIDGLGKNPNPTDICQLSYLDAVVKETLRLYPIALISQPRWVTETVQLDKYEIPPETVLVPCIYLAHRRQQTYPHPEEFLPERFLEKKISAYEYFPFGRGSHGCIGAALSTMEMKLVLATILANHRLQLASDRPIQPVRRGITFVPSPHFRLQVVG